MPGFATPLFLLMLPLPFIAMRVLPAVRARGHALVVPQSVLRGFAGAGAGGGPSVARRWGLPAVLWIALVVALAGPRMVIPSVAAPVSGREIVLAIDLSGSMITKDFELDGVKVQRVDAVKRVAGAFVRRRRGDRLALVLFGSDAYFATPQTYDVEAVASAIEEASIGISGRATGISGALGLALKRLRQSDAPSKVVILLSDGVNNSGAVKPRDAADLAAAQGVRVHTIALGPDDLVEGGIAQKGGVDSATLAAIARLSGGTAFRVRTTADLETVARAIDRLEGSGRLGPRTELYRDLWIWPAIVAFLAALGVLLDRRAMT